MAICSGRGDGGGHCCWVDGEVCEFLTFEGDLPRCSIWGLLPTAEWAAAPIGRFFEERYPGFTCHDWPQNIPEVMARGRGLCCWSDD